MMTSSPAPDQALLERIEQLESAVSRFSAIDSIRQCVTRYMHFCDHLDQNTPMDELAELFTLDAIWEGKGARYANGFGGHRGRSAIAAMLATYATVPPHFRMNAHFLCSENIAVDEAGLGADARWLMLQTSTFADGASHLNAALLELRMKFEQGRWRIAHFQTENIFSRPIDHWENSAPLPTPGH